MSQLHYFDTTMVTPDLAKHWLSVRANNRRLKQHVLAAYVKDMKLDRWFHTGDTIKFNTAGQLCDGQHRLMAVVESGKTIVFDVVHGVDINAIYNIDTGSKRTAGDAVAIWDDSIPKEVSDLAASMCSMITTYNTYGKNANRLIQTKPSDKLPYKAVCEILEQRPKILESARFIKSQGKGTRSIGLKAKVGTFFHYVCGFVNEDLRDSFFHQLLTGTNLNEQDIVYMFRQKVQSESIMSRSGLGIPYAVLLAQTWKYYYNDTPIKMLKWSNGAGLQLEIEGLFMGIIPNEN